ncbi:MAG: hypothetical protein UW79_C0006G0025 [Candidatus Yanofskybacteria bacterium GW2011_GWA2_44_9]|uniref:Uncharacterized protein n=1 Tax=Candidatus Yanofskybacteria bacterium GW2011_GWA2_44_9 TaxID=1619025 RepID=A0A0G1MNR3_9BACT|nr:MAG: hypothetical protein UW79_C0006G0025 [Candidatus Yanofskybacteria bacterium GW2011_GWA2_44_9]
MFKHISINLTEPICGCVHQDLSWNVLKDKDGHVSLLVICEYCKIELRIPHAKLMAYFTLDKGYPQGIKPKQNPVTFMHSREITPEDEKILKELGIKADD